MDKLNYADLYLRVTHEPSQTLVNLIAASAGAVRPSGIIIDAGCGPGLYIPFLAAILGPEGKIIAVDVLVDMILAAKTRSAELSNPKKIKFQLGKIENLEKKFPEHSVDLILCASVLHFTELERATAAFSQVIREGGLLLFSVPMGIANLLDERATGFYRVFREELREQIVRQILLESAAYSVERVMAKKSPRRFKKYTKAVREAGFDIIQQYVTPEIVPASKFADHLVVPWRAQKLLPGIKQDDAERYIRTGVKRAMEKLRVPDNHPFSRNVHYAIARRRTH